MFSWTLLFFGLALLAALVGFGGVDGIAATFAKVLFVAFIALALGALLRNNSATGT